VIRQILTLGLVGFCVCVGYVHEGGSLLALYQPWEWLLIAGTGIGSFVIANPSLYGKKFLKLISAFFFGFRYSKKAHLDLLNALFVFFKQLKKDGKAIEQALESPEQQSRLFINASLTSHPRALPFFCDAMRMALEMPQKKNLLEQMMDAEIEVIRHENEVMPAALTEIAEAMPAIGIVAAVFGMIQAMQHIAESPEIMCSFIVKALVGTLSGILLSYAAISPFAHSLRVYYEKEVLYMEILKNSVVAYLNG